MGARAYGTAIAAAVMVVAGCTALAGCGPDGSGGAGAAEPTWFRPPAASRTPASSHAPAPPPGTASAPSAADPAPTAPTGSPAPTAPADPHACYDGTCEISVSAATEIPVDAHRFGFSRFRVVDVGPDDVTVEATAEGTYLQSTVGPGGTAALNGLAVHVDSVHGGKALLSLTPGA